MQNLDYLLRQFNMAFRLGNLPGLRASISKLYKETQSSTCAPIVRTRFYLEIAKGLRAVGENNRAAAACDLGIANIPPHIESPQLLSALKRLRVLLYLDAGDYQSAQTMLDAVDGLELSLAEGVTQISRLDSDITVETWLLSCEVALVTGEIEAAQRFLDRSIDRLASDEKSFRARRVSPLAIKQKEAENADIRQMISVYAGIIRLVVGDVSGGRALLEEIKQAVAEKNEAALRGASKTLAPNVPLLSKLRCLLGQWSPDENDPPLGINRDEATRFFNLGTGKTFAADSVAPASAPESEAVTSEALSLYDKAPASAPYAPLSDDRTGRVLEMVGKVLERLENVVTAAAPAAPTAPLNTQSIFSGNLLYFDLDAMLFNAKQGELSGYIKFRWSPAHYESQMVLGKLPAAVASGEGYLFLVAGVVIDATLGSAAPSGSKAAAEENFRNLVQLAFSIGLDVPPDILGEAVAAPSVADRPQFISIVQDDFINWLTAVENKVGGFSGDEDSDAQFEMAFAAPLPSLNEATAPVVLEDNSYHQTMPANLPKRFADDDDLLEV